MIAVDGQECFSCFAESLSDVLELDLIFRQQALPVKGVAGKDDSQALWIRAAVPQNGFNTLLVVLVANR